MIPPKRIEEIVANDIIRQCDIAELIRERKQLVAIAESVDKLRNTSLEHGTWYTGCPCEFAENVDEALKAWKGSDERSK